MPEVHPLAAMVADAHLSVDIWKKRPIKSDAFQSFRQIVNYVLEKEIAYLIIAGDLIDVSHPDSETVEFLKEQLHRLGTSGVNVVYVQGQHDMASPPWVDVCFPTGVEVTGKAIHAHKRLVNLVSRDGTVVCCYGLDYRDAQQWAEEAARVPLCDLVVIHQTLTDFMGGLAEGSLSQLANGELVFVGDYHVTSTRSFVNAAGYTATAISPGSTHIRSVNEPPEKFFYVLNQDLSFKRVRLKTRRVVPVDGIVTEAQLTKQANSALRTLSAPDKRFSTKLKPIVCFRHSASIENPLQKVTSVIGDKAHCFCRTFDDGMDVSYWTSEKAETASKSQASFETIAQEYANDDTAIYSMIVNLWKQGPAGAAEYLQAKSQQIRNGSTEEVAVSNTDTNIHSQRVDTKILSARLRNCFQYADITIEFSRGSNLIIGPNGVGKSNLVQAIYSCWTGDFSQVDKGKSGVVRHGIPKKEPSFIELAMEAGGRPFTIRRDLNRVCQLMRSPDGGEIRSDAEIKDMVYRLTGSTETISSYCFIRQEELTAWTRMTYAQRLKWFSSLFGLADAERLHDVIGKQLSSDRGFRDAIAAMSQERMTELREQINQASQQEQQLQGELDKLNEDKDDDKLNAARASLDASRQLAANQMEHQELVKKLTVVKKELAHTRKIVEGAEEQKKRLEEEFEQCQQKSAEAAERLKSLAKQKLWAERLDAAKARKRKAVAKLDSLKASFPKPPKSDRLTPMRADDLRKMREEWSYKRRYLDAIDGKTLSGNESCDFCGQLLTAEHFESLRLETHALFEKIEPLELIASQWATYDQEQRQHKEKRDAATREVAEAEKEVVLYEESLGGGRVDEEEEESLRAILRRRDGLKENLRSTSEVLRGLHERKERQTLIVAKAGAELQNLVKRMDQAKASIQMDEDQARSWIDKLTSLNEQIVETRGRLAEIRSQKQRIESDLQRAIKNAARHDGIVEWIRLCEKTREFYHKSNGPRMLMTAWFSAVARGAQESLALMEMPFSVRPVDENLSFEIVKDDGFIHGVRSLSGAQKVILSIGLWLSIHRASGGKIGVLFMDEPTISLDKKNRFAFGEMCDAIKDLCGSRDMQVVIISHADELNSSHFHNVIDLG